MIENTVAVLTPAGVGAIACVELRGPQAWNAVRQHFRPAGKQPLPDLPVPHRFWFGTLGTGDVRGDEVILSAKDDSLEVQCHGGRRIVRWIAGLFLAQGFKEVSPSREFELLSRATTERTASILLDQYHGVFHRTVELILTDIETNTAKLRRLVELAPLGRHLVEPWRVVIAGPPNVGKSSLLNALAGYTRSIVAQVEGTTRDVVTAALAFDGWPIELSDTAGLHESTESLEAAGIAKAGEELARADLVVWVMDATVEVPVEPLKTIPSERLMVVWNKCDELAGRASDEISVHADGELQPSLARPANSYVSALTHVGIPELISSIVSRLVPFAPVPLEAVPYSRQLADAVERAWTAFALGNLDAARTSLATCLASNS